MGQHMRPAHFGLGPTEKIERMTIRWPSGTVQTLTDVTAGQRVTVEEPSG